MPTQDIAIGVVAALAVQWAKTSPAFPWLTPEVNKTLQALLIIFSVVVGLVHAAQTPGDLAKLDWNATLKTVLEASIVVWLAAVNFYQHVLNELSSM